MTVVRRRRVAKVLWVACSLLGAPPLSAAVTVAVTAPNGVAARAGFESGDVIESWRDGGVLRPITSPLDVDRLRLVDAQRAAVVLVGHRNGKMQAWRLPPAEWDFSLSPELDDGTAAVLAGVTRRLEGAPSPEVAKEAVEHLLASTDELNVRDRAWLGAQVAGLLAAAELFVMAEPLLDDLRGLTAYGLGVDDYGLALLRAGSAMERHAALSELQAVYQRAIEQLESERGHALLLARALERIAGLEASRGHHERAEPLLLRCLELSDFPTRDSLVAASALNGLASMKAARGDLPGAAGDFERIEALLVRLGADESALRIPIGNLGTLAVMTGDLAAGQARFERALEITQRTMPRDAVAPLLNNLGIVAVRRGDLVSAERYYQLALTVNKQADAQHHQAFNLYNLADIAARRRDAATSVALLHDSAAGFRSSSPDSIPLANALANLADQQLTLGRNAEARRHGEEALAIFQRHAPASKDKTAALKVLARLTLLDGDPAGAERYLSESLALSLQAAPLGPLTGTAHLRLADLYFETGEISRAEQSASAALAVLSLSAPGSADEAQALHALGRIAATRGHEVESRSYYEQALTALERQSRRLGGADRIRSRWEDGYAAVYREHLRALLASGDEAGAFAVLERYRARAFLTQLAERDLVLDADLSPELRRARQLLTARYEQLHGELARLSPENREDVLNRLRRVQAERSALEQRLHAESPRFADLRYPEPLDFAAASAALPAGAVALSFSVHPDVTLVFRLEPGAREPVVTTVPVGEAALRRHVRRLRTLIELGADAPPASVQAMSALAVELYDLLVRPALPDRPFTRLLVVPDGPLHLLPFVALVDRERDGRYLVQAWPVHQVLSLTLYQELVNRRARTAWSATLTAFAIPEPEALDGRPQALAALPSAGAEAEAIVSLFGDRGTAFVGVQATEGRLRSLTPGPRYLHFATHTLLSGIEPLDSALVLAGGERNSVDGLLHSWEVLEYLRLATELVVLSACATGRGEESGGDGLIGLTRAFHHAGARSVVASLWNVADRSTSLLMQRFYAALRDGSTFDEALRAAQLALLNGEQDGWRAWLSRSDDNARYAHPFYWAPFTLSGAYR